ncbi:MAG: hypothetical protein A3K18_14340 [Lentisphaerae bacterium RIFOXYA12_64_32]|nr:MAG: hypothetical protein A3K18_14340 [Lentisphaerae bacterium RIFOXYA12_64_32]
MAFMTGLFPMDLEIWTNGGLLASDVPTFAHQLGLAGYETILCGAHALRGSGPEPRLRAAAGRIRICPSEPMVGFDWRHPQR